MPHKSPSKQLNSALKGVLDFKSKNDFSEATKPIKSQYLRAKDGTINNPSECSYITKK